MSDPTILPDPDRPQPPSERMGAFEARRALATAKSKRGLMSQHVFDARVAWIEANQADGYVDLPSAWLSEPAGDDEAPSIGGAAPLYSAPSEFLATALRFLGWVMLAIGFVGALASLGNPYADPATLVGLAVSGVVTSAVLHGLAGAIELLRSIDNRLHRESGQ